MSVSTINLDDFDRLTDFIYRKTGIRYERKKQYFLSKRIEKRMQALGIESAPDYIRRLRFTDPDSSELQSLVNLLTINETYFFRDFPQLQCFGEHCLQDALDRKRAAGDRSLRIWSAGCSTGEEPFTIAIILMEMIDDIGAWDIAIEASDIDLTALEKCREGMYEERCLRDVPAPYLDRYFKRIRNGSFKLSATVRQMARFEHINLSDKAAIRAKRDFDFIFCRNVLIYFDDVSRKRLVDQFYVALRPGGYIFLGSSESVGRISTAFSLKRMGGYIVYHK